MVTIKTKVYIASGWFNKEQVTNLKVIEGVLSLIDGLHVYSPRKHAGVYKESKGNHVEIVQDNLVNLLDTDLVVASTEGKDLGTLFECGYAYALNKQILYYYPHEGEFNIMLAATGAVAATPEDLLKQVSNYLNKGFLPSNYTGGML